MQEKKDIKVTREVRALVWKHWKPVFLKSKWSLLGTALFFSFSMILDLLIKPLCWREVFDGLATGGTVHYYFNVAVMVSVASFIISGFGEWCITIAESRIIRNLKEYVLRGLLGKSMQFFSDNSSGGLVAKSKRFAAVSESVIDEVVLSITRTGILMVYLLVFTLITIPKLTAILVLWCVLFGWVVTFILRKRVQHDLASSNADSVTTGYISDTLLSVFSLRIFTAARRHFEKFQNVVSDEEYKRKKAWYIGNLQWRFQAAMMIALEFICMSFVIREIENGVYKVGMAALVQSYVATLGMYMWGLGKSLNRVRASFADAYEMAQLLDEPTTESLADTQVIPKHAHGIRFNQVSFSYPDGAKILNEFSFHFEESKSYGIIGKTGSGKSTITKLIMNFYQHDKGEIMMRGKFIGLPWGSSSYQHEQHLLDKNTLRSLISFVPQHPIFPSTSIREIIKLGKPDATENQVIIAAKQAQCDFIWKKKHGLDTIIGERGVKLSGGEQQRLAIAAAILKDAPYVIMDEPTSALDAATEHAIQTALQTSFKGKTMIVIAHRLATVAVLDEIILLDKGAVVAHGPHSDLLEKSSLYKEMWDLQTNPHIFTHE